MSAPTDWTAALKAANTDRELFEATVAQLMADKAVTAARLSEIVEAYTGVRRKARNRTELFERIRDQFETDVQYRAKVAAIERITRTGN